MNDAFPNVAILGGGLLGGSLAMALARLNDPPNIRLWSRREETTQQALAAGITGATSDLQAAVRNADLLVLSVPVGTMPDLISRAIDSGLPGDCLITDVGSVKQMPHHSLRPLLTPRGQAFIGSHPMAGSEQGGIHSASADLFKGAACLLTNDEQRPEAETRALESFWQAVGCKTSWTDAQAHDALVARISHLPHAVAAAAARVCLANPADGTFGGGGLRDTTRVAAGNTDMWTEILIENRSALREPLEQMIAELQQLLAALDTADQEATRQWLVTAKDRRDRLNPRS